MVQEQFEEHDKELPDLLLIKHLWDVLEEQV